MSDLLTLLGDGGEISAVKDAMVAAFRAAMPRAIEIYRGTPDTVHLPCMCVAEAQVTPSRTMGNQAASGMEEMILTVHLYASAADDQDGERIIDALVSRDGLVRSALWAMRGAPGQLALGGAADDLYLFDVTQDGIIPMGDNGAAYGATLSVRVIVS